MRSAVLRCCYSLGLGLVVGALALIALEPAAARADSVEAARWAGDEAPSAADELLQDGLDALADGRTGLAREAFEYLLEHHPASTAAPRARDELRRLDGDDEVATEPSNTTAAASEDRPSDPETVMPAAAEAPAPTASTPNDQPAVAPAPSPSRMTAAADIQALQSEFTRKVGDRVFFAESNAALGGNAKTMLAMQARWLATKSNVAIHVVGHADDLGSAASNIDLSRRRAEAVRDYLASSGIDAARITIEYVGSGQPVALCSDAACRTQNRRAVAMLRPFDPATARTASSQPPATATDAIVRQ